MSAQATWSFAGERALVTGAGRGIGRAVALGLADAGAHVTAVARSAGDLDALAAAAGGCDGELATSVADVRDEPALERIVAAARPHLLVTAAGINQPGPLLDTPIADVRDILDVNVTGTLIACRAFARAAIAAERPGVIVTLSSQMGTVGYPGRVAYCASKHAVNGLTKALALEWAAHGVRVNAVAPTFIHTPLTAPFFAEPGFHDEVLSRIPLGRIGEVDDVLGAVLFLLSKEAGLVTGHVLAVDGGWTVQ